MSPQVGLALGVLLGAVIVWLVFSVYWRRWRGYLTRDMMHLQAKVKSVEATNIGLERQMSAQKTDLAGMRSKINTLETENRLARSRIESCEAEKQSLSEHLSTLRGELAACHSLLVEADLAQSIQPRPAAARSAAARPANGTTPIPVNGNGAAAKSNGNGAGHTAEEALAQLFALSQDVLAIPADGAVRNGAVRNGAAHKNGNSTHGSHAPRTSKPLRDLPPEQVILPEVIILRPQMNGDRLEIIQGIGPALAKRLHQEGIDSFRVLAAQTPERLKEIAGPRLARLIDANRIIEQAKRIIGEP